MTLLRPHCDSYFDHFMDHSDSSPLYGGSSGSVVSRHDSSIQFASAAVALASSSTHIVHNIEAIIQKVLSTSGAPSTAISVTLDTSSWYFDSACYNHMTSDPTLFSSTTCPSNLPSTHTADGSQMHVRHVGYISTSNVSLPHTYLIPNLTLNLFSISQLCDLGLTVLFSPPGYVVQDPMTGQTLGIGHRHGRLYELIHRHILSSSPSNVEFAAFTTISSPLTLWHSQLGHVSFGRLRSLVSSGQLGDFPNDKVDYLSCQLAKQPALPFTTNPSLLFDELDIDTMTLGHPEDFAPPPGLAAPLPDPEPASTPAPVPPPSHVIIRSPSEPHISLDSITSSSILEVPLRHFTRVTQPSVLLRDFIVDSTAFSSHEPISYQEAWSNPLWQQAISDELQALDKTHTWDVVDLPPGKSVMSCKWVYKLKTHSEGSIECYKAHLVAWGFTQEYEIDYEETFASVARLTSVRSLLAVVATRH
ncbi:uncharacterized protein LOC114267861 [Camellia sinensis]|uniref:uncharacterized protein LOC114267861 n=1 Tax=Camellia sinensis TaxID=4442 RepID=UPI001036D768|nr:uncharacterized protein LOC114267861 [Camellia sinensis]